MVHARQFRLGLFVLTGLLLLLGLVLFLGLSEIFATRIKFVTLFGESVQGLAVGSPVKYKGVPIGSVSSISILVDEQLIRVDMQIDPKVFVSGSRADSRAELLARVLKFCREESRRGLRCQLEFAGLTGMKYVEMNYFDPGNKLVPLPPPSGLGADDIYFAATPSVFTNLIDAMAVSLEKIAKIDFERIGNDLQGSLAELRRLLANPALTDTMTRMEAIARNVETTSKSLSETLTSTELRKILDGVDQNLTKLSDLTGTIKTELTKANFPDMVKRISEAAGSIRLLAEALERSRTDFNWSLHKVDQLIDLAGEVVEYIGKDPNSLLSGKRTPVIDFKKK